MKYENLEIWKRSCALTIEVYIPIIPEDAGFSGADQACSPS